MKKNRFFVLLAAILLLVGCGTREESVKGDSQWKTAAPWRTEQNWETVSVKMEETAEEHTLQQTDSQTQQMRKNYTLMVYLVGSNLESEGESASADLLEMIGSGLDLSRTNLVIYTGGSKNWRLNIPSASNNVYTLREDGKGLTCVGSTKAPKNMGDAATLRDFLNFSYDSFPAENYGLICWDHGAGPLGGFGADELFAYDSLSLPEMQAALEASPFAEEKLELIGFDACLMASLEVAQYLSPYGENLIASEELEPSSGWDYSALTALNEGGTAELAERILTAYEASMAERSLQSDYTLAWIDLTKIPAVDAALDDLYGCLREDIEDGSYAAVAQKRSDVKRLGGSGLEDSCDLVDLRHLSELLAEEHPQQAQQLQTSLDQAVVRQVTNLEKVGGLSVYHPYDNKELFRNGGSALYNTVNSSVEQKNYMKAFTGAWLYGELDTAWAEDLQIQAEDGQITVALPEEHLADVGGVYAHILQKNGDTFEPVLVTELQLDGGKAEITDDFEVIVTKTDREGELPLLSVKDQGQENRYRSHGVLFADLSHFDAYRSVVFDLAEENGELILRNVTPIAEADVPQGRMEEDLSHWGEIARLLQMRYETYDENGNLLPWTQWKSGGSSGFESCSYDEEITFEKVKISDLEGEFYCQLALRDICGNTMAVSLHPLGGKNPLEQVEIDSMTFDLYEDHAELVQYTGNEPKVVIPDEVENVPVTVVGKSAFQNNQTLEQVTLGEHVREIGQSAFYWCMNLAEVQFSDSLEIIDMTAFDLTALTRVELPDSLRHIGARAFSYTKLEQVEIPAGVTSIGAGAFDNCEELTAFRVKPGGHYREKDGVLYSADGKTLCLYPSMNPAATFTVPEGVETVGFGAFMGAENLEEVILPESLKTIDCLAFCNAIGLKSVCFPDGLECVRSMAFAVTLGADDPAVMNAVQIGASFRYLGEGAFMNRPFLRYEVSEENESFSEKDGLLLNKSGTRLIGVPMMLEGELTVPNGVSYVEGYALDGCNQITAITYPDSVVVLSNQLAVPTMLERVSVGNSLSDWGGLKRHPFSLQVEISEENPYFAVFDGSVYTKDMTELLAHFGREVVFSIPEGVERIAPGALIPEYTEDPVMKCLILPASLKELPDRAFERLYLEQIEVAAGNEHFAVHDGNLYSADGTRLLYVPKDQPETVTIRPGTVEICEYAFGRNFDEYGFDTVILPEGVKVLRYGNFNSGLYSQRETPLQLHLPESLTDIHPEMLYRIEEGQVQVYCPAGSVADQFAREQGAEVINP